MELAARDLAARVVRQRARPLAQRGVLAREGRMGFEHVCVHVDVYDVAEGGMRRGAVVALEEVLDRDLPVRRERVVDACVEAQP